MRLLFEFYHHIEYKLWATNLMQKIIVFILRFHVLTYHFVGSLYPLLAAFTSPNNFLILMKSSLYRLEIQLTLLLSCKIAAFSSPLSS